MALNRRRYVVKQIEGPMSLPDQFGQISRYYRVHYLLGDRHAGTVLIPFADMSAENVARILDAEVQKISDIFSLGSS